MIADESTVVEMPEFLLALTSKLEASSLRPVGALGHRTQEHQGCQGLNHGVAVASTWVLSVCWLLTPGCPGRHLAESCCVRLAVSTVGVPADEPGTVVRAGPCCSGIKNLSQVPHQTAVGGISCVLATAVRRQPWLLCSRLSPGSLLLPTQYIITLHSLGRVDVASARS